MTKQHLADGKAAAQAQQDNGGPKAENKLSGHEKLFSAESARNLCEQEAPAGQSNNLPGKAHRLCCTGSAVTWRGKLWGPEKLFSARIHYEQEAPA